MQRAHEKIKQHTLFQKNITAKTDIFKSVEQKNNYLILNQNICCGYSK